MGAEKVPPLVTVRAVLLRFRLPAPAMAAMFWEDSFRFTVPASERSVPVARIAAEEMLTLVLTSEPGEASSSEPAVTLVAPVYVLAAESFNAPPETVIAP